MFSGITDFLSFLTWLVGLLSSQIPKKSSKIIATNQEIQNLDQLESSESNRDMELYFEPMQYLIILFSSK